MIQIAMLLLSFYSFALQTEQKVQIEYYFNVASQMKLNSLYDWEKGFTLEKPIHTKVPLVELQNMDMKYCLFYKIPPKSESNGEIGIVQTSSKESCFNSLSGHEVLRVRHSKEKAFFKSSMMSSRIEIFLEENKPLLVKRSLMPREYKRYSHYLADDPIEAVDFLHDLKNKKMVAEKGDNYRDQSAKLCRKISKDCQVIFDECSKCPFGAFEVLKTGCQKDFVYCGRDFCGLNGFPACIRYKPTTKFRSAGNGFPCEVLKEVSMCRKGLEPTCDGNGIVICL